MNMQTNVPPHVRPEQVFDFDIYADQRVTQNVQESCVAALREAPDVFWTPRNGGHWIIQRSSIVADIVKNPEIFSAREMQIPRVENPPYMIPLSVDPPQNVPYRRALMPKFSPREVAALEPKMRSLAVTIVDAVADKGACDFVQDVSAIFPVTVFMEVMGLPVDKLREFRELADSYFRARTAEEYVALSGEIFAIFNSLLDLRTQQPADDLITHLLGVDIDGRPITRDEILAMCYVLFLGGMDTVTNVMGFTFQHLATDPELQARLVADPTLIPKFVEEGLRLYGVINTPRLVIQNEDRHGVSFREGDMVLNMLMATGRDDSVHINPDAFDIDRTDMSHLNFSTGPHLCLGHVLARAEMKILVEEWIKRVPAFQSTAGGQGFRIGTVTAIESLPIEWDVA